MRMVFYYYLEGLFFTLCVCVCVRACVRAWVGGWGGNTDFDLL